MALKSRLPKVAPVEQSVEITDLTGGLQLRLAPTQLAENQAQRLKNFSISRGGALETFPGWRAFTTVSLGSSPIQGGRRIYLGAQAPFTLVAWNGGIYRPSDAGVWGSAETTALSSNASGVFFVHDRDLVAFFDSTSPPLKSTGSTTWTRFGIVAPSDAATPSSQAGGNLSSGAEFEFSYTYKHRGLSYESNETTAVSTLTLSSTGAVRLVVPNSADPQVDAIVIYARNKTFGESVRRRATSGPASAGPTSTLVVTSSGWTSADEAPTRHHVLDSAEFGVVWKNRWWVKDGTKGNRLRFSELFLPQAFPALFYLDLPFILGDEIRALVPLGDALAVFGDRGIFLVIGESSLDFVVKPSAGAQAGAFGPKAAVQVETGIIHASAEGVFSFDGSQDRLLSHDIEPGWRDLVSVNPAELKHVALAYEFRHKRLRVAVPRLYPSSGPGEFVLDLLRTQQLRRPAWLTTDRAIRGYLPWDGAEPEPGSRGELLSWSTGGQLWKESTGSDANGADLKAEYLGPGLTFDQHQVQVLWARGEYEPASGSLSVDFHVDKVPLGAQSASIAAGVSRFDEAQFDVSVFATANRRSFYLAAPLKARGNEVAIELTYTGKDVFRLFTYALGVVPDIERRRVGV